MKGNNNRSRAHGLISDTIAFTISNFASKILVFLLVPLYTAVLTTTEYGIADLLSNTINMVYPILTLSIMEATLRFALDEDCSKEDVLTNSLFVVFVNMIPLTILMPIVKLLSLNLFNYWLWFLAMYFGFNVSQIIAQYVKGMGFTKQFAVSGVIQTVVVITTNIVGLLVLRLGLNAYLLAIILGYASSIIYLIISTKIKINRIRINTNLLKQMIKYSTPMIPAIISWWISTSADKYIIIAYCGLAASGIYSVAYKIPSILSMMSNIFTSAWTISAVKSIDDKDSKDYQLNMYNAYNSINVIVCVGLIILSQVLGKILFSKDFYEAWHCVPFLVIAYLFSGLAGFMASSFRASRHTKGLISSTLLGAIVNIVLNIFVIKSFGMIGASITTVIGFAVTFYIRTLDYKKIVGVIPNLLRDSIIYFILFTLAFLISFESQFAYVLGIMVLILIFIVYRQFYLQLMKICIKYLKVLMKRR